MSDECESGDGPRTEAKYSPQACAKRHERDEKRKLLKARAEASRILALIGGPIGTINGEDQDR